MSTSEQTAAGKAGKKSRLRKLAAFTAIALLILLAAGVALAPTIGSSLAPGIIEGAVNPGIEGRLKVHKASIGWFSGLQAGPIEVYDPAGALAASVQASSPVTVWQALSGRYWSAKSLDLGTVEVSGKADVRQYNDGSTNLDRAFRPKGPAATTPPTPAPAKPAPAEAGKPLPAVKATLKITQLDVSVRNEKDQFAGEIGLKQFKGEAKIDADLSATGGGVVKALADFSGNAVTSSAGATGSPVAITLDADLKQTAAGTWSADGIERAKIKLALTNLPIAVADALGNFGGALVQGIGDAADIHLDVDGNASQMAAAMKMSSTGLNADASLAIKDGQLSAEPGKPTSLSLKSTEFLQNFPPTREGVAKAGQQVKLTQAPSIAITLESLRVPIAKSGEDPAKLDFRGANVAFKVKVSGIAGQVLLPEGAGGAPSAAANAAGGSWKPFTVEPVDLAVNIADFAKPITIATGTKATLDGQPAGDISLSLNADGLLDAQGHVRALSGGKAGFADKAEARVRIAGMSTALLQPIVAGAAKDLPLQLAQDVGPTLDFNLLAKADVAGVVDPGALGNTLEALPPLGLTGEMASRNIHASLATRLEKAMLTTQGEGVKLTVDAAAPLAQRIVKASRDAHLKDPNRDPKTAPPPEITLTGAGKIELTVKDLAISLKDTSPAAILSKGRGNASLALADLNAAVDMGGNKSPVRIERHTLTAALASGANPKIAVDGALSHENQPFTVTGGYEFAKLDKGLPTGSGPAQFAALKPVGAIEVKSLPRSVLGIVPALSSYASDAPAGAAGAAAEAAKVSETSRQIAAAVRDAIGAGANLTVRAGPAPADKGGGHYAAAIIATAADGAFARVWLRVTEELAEISTFSAYVQARPQGINPVLASLAMPPEPGQPAPAPMRLGSPVKLTVDIDKPAKIPFITRQDGSVAMDWSKADELLAKIAASGELVIDNVPMGGGGKDDKGQPIPFRTASLALRNLGGEVRLPLSGIPDEARARTRAAAKLGAAAFNRTAGDASLGKFDLDAQANMDGSSPDATAKLVGVSMAALEGLLGKKDLLVGALGETADVNLRVKPGTPAAGVPAAGEVIALDVEMTSPRIAGGKLSLAKDDGHLWLTQPLAATWTPNEAFVNKYFFGGVEPKPQPVDQPKQGRRRRKPAPAGATPPAALSLEQTQPITISISKLALALGGSTAPGAASAGPLKPGVFELDLGVKAPSMSVNVAPAQAGQPPTRMTIEGLNLAVTSAKTAPGAPAPSPIELNLGIDRVSGAGSQAKKRSTAKVQISNLADARGVIDAAQALINADVDIETFPTPIVDNLANQNGVLTELLGPTVSLVATARNVSKGAPAGGHAAPAASNLPGGQVNIEATSPRATAKIPGTIRNSEFVQNGPLKIEIREIRSQLVEVLAGGLPVVQSLEKTPQDEPATIITEGLSVPLDNDLRKLNGKITVDPGVARFTTNDILGQIIKGIGGREGGAIGRKIEPFVVTLNHGVANYDRFNLPLGEFSLATRGQVDLVNNSMNVVTYVPFFALSDEAAGKLNIGLAGKVGVLDRNTMIPITTKGSLDKPETKIDLELFLQEAGENLIKSPGKLIEELLKPKDKKK